MCFSTGKPPHEQSSTQQAVQHGESTAAARGATSEAGARGERDPDTRPAAQGAPLVCAHGGDAASGHPANTREAVLAAAAGGAPCIELDVSVTADGRLVPLHARELGQLLPARAGAQVDQLVLAEVEALEWRALNPAGCWVLG
jgi:glycerophosphoryl diester phosphodiesterase